MSNMQEVLSVSCIFGVSSVTKTSELQNIYVAYNISIHLDEIVRFQNEWIMNKLMNVVKTIIFILAKSMNMVKIYG